MIDPFNNMRKYLIWSFILIIFLIMSGIAVADNHDLDLDKKSFAEVQEIEWHNADGTIQRSIKVEDGSQKFYMIMSRLWKMTLTSIVL